MSSTVRTKVFVAALAAAAAVAFVSTGASALSALDSAGNVVSSGEPVPPTSNPPLPPTANPTPPPTTAPPLPTPTPSDEQCPVEPFIATTIALRSKVMAGPVTCEDIHSNITVSWDGAKVKVVIVPATDFAEGKCELVKASVKAVQPNTAVVKADGSVEVPYARVKISIKIEYDFKCTLGRLEITLKKVVDIEFTPPDGPVVIKNKNRP